MKQLATGYYTPASYQVRLDKMPTFFISVRLGHLRMRLFLLPKT